MTEFLRDDDGQPVFVCGYAAPYNSLSCPLDSLDGKRELILPGAFDLVLRNLRASTTCSLHHMAAGGTIGSIFDRTLQLWVDRYGLAFRCGPLAINSKNAWAVRSIVSGGARGCSWRGIVAEVATEKIEGEQVVVIKKLQHLSHISPLSSAAASYPGAATWCSHECPYDLPHHMRPLARHWQEHRPAACTRTRQALPARAATSRPELAAAAHHEAKKRHQARQLARRRAASNSAPRRGASHELAGERRRPARARPADLAP